MAVTLQDIAEKARVSTTVVSHVLNNRAKSIRVSAKTRENVLNVIRDMDHQPNLFAKSLREQKSHTLGVIAVDLRDQYVVEVVSGVEKIATGRGYCPLICSVENNRYSNMSFIENFRRNQAEGILFIGSTLVVPERVYEELDKEKIYAVSVAKKLGENVPFVGIDNVKGGFLATEYLIKLGHKKIGHIAGPDFSEEYGERFKGYKMALEHYGLEYDERLVERVKELDTNSRLGYDAVKNLFQRGNIPTGLFVFEDLSAFGVIRAIEEIGLLKVPEDISVIGFDDIPAASYYNPPLTTVRQPMLEMGEKSAELLIDIIENKSKKNGVKNIILQPELIIRNT